MNFEVGDHVYASDWGEGIIVSIHEEDQEALVEMDTGNFGGLLPFEFNELKHVIKRKAMLKAFKSCHKSVNVIIQNCSAEVVTLLHRLDIWHSNGNYKYDENKPEERAEIWFELPMEFLDFIRSEMGRKCFQRMGVEEIDV